MIEIPNFTVERELGRGGMATVYLAEQDMLSRHVALKVMLPDMARDDNFRKNFLSEGKIIANLEHTNIVRIYDVGVIDDSILYMAMEYLSKGTLKEKLNEGKLSYEKSLKILEETSAGLSYAHAKGYIHRDIKPGNILFRKNGTAVITDFGIAKLQDTSGELTRMGYTMGTVQYMSPEQAVTTDLDHRSDIYSLGLVFYEMLTGQKAFKAESTIQAIHQHTTVAPPELPLEYGFLQSTIDKVLAKEPEDRFQSAVEFVDAVKNARQVDDTVIHRNTPLIDDDSTQILRTGHYQVDTQKVERKGKKGLVAGVVSSLVLLGGFTFGVTKYPEISSWLDQDSTEEDLQQQLIEETAKQELDNQQLALIEREKLKEDQQAKDKLIAVKLESDRRKVEEENLRIKIEQDKQEKLKNDEAVEITRTEENRKITEQESQRKIAEAEAKQKALEAEQRERDRVLSEQQIALAEKQALEAEQKRLRSEAEERDRKLAEQIAKAEKQAEEAKKRVEQERLADLEAERLQQEKLIAEQEELAKINAEKEKLQVQQEQEKIELALVEKKKLAAEKLEQEKIKANQDRLDAEAAALRKQKEDKIAEERLVQQQLKEKIAKEKKRKEDLANKRLNEAKLKKDLARKKADQAKKRKAALIAKKKADAIRRQQQLANSRGQIRVSATLNGRPLNTSFVVTQNGKRVKAVGGRASVNFVLPPGRYVVSTSYSGKMSRANVNLEPNDIVTQGFAFRASAPVQQPKPNQQNWTHEHKNE